MCLLELGKKDEAWFFCNVTQPGSIGFVLVILQSLMEEDELVNLKPIILLALKSFGKVMVTSSSCVKTFLVVQNFYELYDSLDVLCFQLVSLDTKEI